METRSRYAEGMERVDRDVAQMGALLLEMLQRLYRVAAHRGPVDLAAFYQSDRRVNEFEGRLIAQTVRMLTLEQPVASDLRRLICVLRVSSELERIGDHVVHIAKIFSRGVEFRQELELFPAMVDWVVQMLDRALTAFSRRDLELARGVMADDATLDDMHQRMLHTTMTELHNRPGGFEAATQVLFLTRFIERMGDHIVNVCEWCVYTLTGRLQESYC